LLDKTKIIETDGVKSRTNKPSKILLSIGSVTSKEAIDYIKQGFIVYAYDPRKSAFEDYLKVQRIYSSSMYPYALAVSDFNGESDLSQPYDGSATITIFEKVKPGSYKVQTVSMASILKQFKHIDLLLINCEGSEIPIILNTDLYLFEKCYQIDVSFHHFVSYLKITMHQIKQCLDKMHTSFNYTLIKPKHPFYSFINKAR